MSNNAFILFLIEIWKRLTMKSPKLFIYLQWVTGLLTAITGLPTLLDKVFLILNWTPPAAFAVFENKTVALCSLVGLFFSMLPVQNDTKAKSSDGQPLKVTDNKKLPFTARAEAIDLKLSDDNHPTVGINTKK